MDIFDRKKNKVGFSVRAMHTKISITTTLKGLFFLIDIFDRKKIH